MIWLSGVIFSMVLSATTADTTPPPREYDFKASDLLNRAAKSGDLTLTVRSNGETGHKTQILAVEAMGCFIVFKTQISESSFSARAAELGEGISLNFTRQKNEISLRSSSNRIELLTLGSEQPIEDIFGALQSFDKNCSAGVKIF